MGKYKIVLVLLLLFVFISSQGFASDYFLYDAEKSSILHMGGKSTEFAENLNMDKNPDYLMPTNNPNKFLAIFVPEVGTKRSIFKKTQEVADQAGQLILFNIETGRTEDLVELGYAPFTYEYTEDHKYFVITYKTSSATDSPYELLYYNIAEQKSAKLALPGFTKVVNQIKISPELKQIFLLLDNTKRELTKKETGLFAKKQDITGTPELVTLSFSPLAIKKELPLESCPLQMNILSPDRAVLICQDYQTVVDSNDTNKDFIKAGVIRVINLKDYSVINEYTTGRLKIYRRWYPKEKTLIVNYTVEGTGLLAIKGRKEVYLKINSGGVQSNDFAEMTGAYQYIPERDCLYVVILNNLAVINYKTSTVTNCDTGSNWANGLSYNFNTLPNTDLAVIYSFEKSTVKFIDLKENKMLKKVSCGRGAMKVFSSIFKGFFGQDTGIETTVSVSPDKSKFFIFNKLSNDISVYDQNYERQSFIIPKEQAIGMYVITKPSLQTVLVTNKSIYKLDYTNNTLVPIYDFTKKIEWTWLLTDEYRTVVLSDNEVLVLDSANLEVKNKFMIMTDKKETYTKLKPGDQRYFFLFSL